MVKAVLKGASFYNDTTCDCMFVVVKFPKQIVTVTSGFHWLCSCRAMLYGPGHAKMCLMPYVNNKGADQPAHSRSLISTFVVCCLDSMISVLAIPKISRF